MAAKQTKAKKQVAEKQEQKKMPNRWLLAIVAVLALALIALVAFGNSPPAKTASSNGQVLAQPANTPTLPSFATKSPKVQEAYLFARDNPDALTGVNCYCGCMQTLKDDRLHTRGIVDCFLELNGSFNIHGSTCDRCVEEALTVKSLVAQGKTKEEIKSAITAMYSNVTMSCTATNPANNNVSGNFNARTGTCGG